MSFGFPDVPESKEIRLVRSPLKEVVCQVRFPTILSIKHEDPTGLQERLRSRFPAFEVEQPI
ncbi:MAG: TIGR04255 family protein, partial [Anaerolineae bacterium]